MPSRSDLQCDVKSMSYDFETQTGTLHMAEGDNCDMTGCTALFERVDPQVKNIRTFSGAAEDTSYRRAGPLRDWVARAVA